MSLSFDLRKPIYLQIIDEIKRKIVRGELSPGEKIPSQREMARMIVVNPNTVQRAYQKMEQIGLVETLRGQGTFIRKDPQLWKEIRAEMAREAIRTFLQEMTALNFNPGEIISMVEEALFAGK